MENSLYNIEQIVKISKNQYLEHFYEFCEAKYINLFGVKFKIFDECYKVDGITISKDWTEQPHLYRKDNKFYMYPFLKFKFSNGDVKPVYFKNVEEMEEKFNWWKSNYPNLIEL